MSAATWPIPCGIRVYLYHLNLPPSSSPPQGYGCSATDAELARYLDYTPRALCPQDWFFVQRLIFMRDCFSLPRRRCMAVTPARVEEVSHVAQDEVAMTCATSGHCHGGRDQWNSVAERLFQCHRLCS